MASVNERIFRLEAKAVPRAAVPPAMDRLLDAVEDARREIAGLPLLPRPYTAADREDDIHFLEEVLPKYRTDEGWQSEEARAILDGWEEKTRAKLEGENQ